VFNEGISDRGKILTRISNNWFKLLKNVKNHIIETDVNKMPEPFKKNSELLKDRVVMVKKCNRINYEFIVRGHLMGSGYNEYKNGGTVSGEKLPSGLKSGSKLPHPIFTPSTKADSGHDINVTFDIMASDIGFDLSNQLKNISIQIYNSASQKLAKHGILLADTKFEFGILNNEIILIDEVLTPDSSRYLRESEFNFALENQLPLPSMDKQILRDYLNTLDWDKNPPPPKIPDHILEQTRNKYLEIEKVIECISQEM